MGEPLGAHGFVSGGGREKAMLGGETAVLGLCSGGTGRAGV